MEDRKKIEEKIRNYIRDITTSAYKDSALDFDVLIENIAKKDINNKDISINVFLSKFDNNNIRGFLQKEKEGNKWNIYVNGRDSVHRRRSAIAHELGHLISYINGSYSNKEINNSKEGLIADLAFYSNGDDNLMEREAEEIAMDLLMPKNEFISLYKEKKNTEEMANRFQVPETAMLIRFFNLVNHGFELKKPSEIRLLYK